MATKKKLLQAAAGAAGGGEVLYSEDVFASNIYRGGSAYTGTTNVNIADNGGMMMIKGLDNNGSFVPFDSERSNGGAYLEFASGGAETSLTHVTFNTDGFSLTSTGYSITNNSSYVYASFSFRKAEKFFDVQSWTGNGTLGRQISHDLNGNVGCIMVKRTDTTADWRILHRGAGGGSSDWVEFFMAADAGTTAGSNWGDGSSFIAPTSTYFTVNDSGDFNTSGGTYVAYIFAHNNSDGTFGENSDQDIIKCGQYSGTGNNRSTINIGFEPCFLIIKNRTAGNTDDWLLMDSNVGLPYPKDTDSSIFLNLNNSNNQSIQSRFGVYPYGFGSEGSNAGINNASGKDYIYIAIRKPMKAPEDADDVFDLDTLSGAGSITSTTETSRIMRTDMAWFANTGGNSRNVQIASKPQGYWTATNVSDDQSYTPTLYTNSTSAMVRSQSNSIWYDYNATHPNVKHSAAGSGFVGYGFKRATGFCDVLGYEGNGQTQQAVSHNLGITPEMIWVKNADSGSYSWMVYHKDVGNTQYLRLDTSATPSTDTGIWNDTSPTSTDFTVGNDAGVNQSGVDYFAYLWGTVDGVSKVGSFSHSSGSNTNVDCGFSSAARLVLVKRTNSAEEWQLFDTARGIVTGEEPKLKIDTADAQQNGDFIDPSSSGFSAGPEMNTGNYIFLAIA